MTGRASLLFIAVMASCAAAAPSQAADVVAPVSRTLEVPETKKTPVEWGRDIFDPLVKGVIIPDLRLKAVFFNAERPSAIVNDRIVYEGDTVKGQKIIDIGKTHVILESLSGTVTLEIAGVPDNPQAP